MFQRIWYLPDEWWSAKCINKLDDWHNLVRKENAENWEEKSGWRFFPHVYLVNRPITFGHSQLVMPIPDTLRHKLLPYKKESVYFEFASIIIKRAIQRFEEIFGEKALHKKTQFRDLAKQTFSYGRYLKTLIIRASADENIEDVYKVHLIPYFDSNDALCQKRYCSIHRVSLDKKGGLIGWLGERETEVDSWHASNFKLSNIARDTWKLPELASELRR